MKCELICQTCAAEMRKRYPTGDGLSIQPYPGEHIKFVQGKAKKKYTCDNCGTTIYDGQLCTAFTIWAEHSPNPYTQWEGEYINIDENEK